MAFIIMHNLKNGKHRRKNFETVNLLLPNIFFFINFLMVLNIV
jgi:hypothetical protein